MKCHYIRNIYSEAKLINKAQQSARWFRTKMFSTATKCNSNIGNVLRKIEQDVGPTALDHLNLQCLQNIRQTAEQCPRGHTAGRGQAMKSNCMHRSARWGQSKDLIQFCRRISFDSISYYRAKMSNAFISPQWRWAITVNMLLSTTRNVMKVQRTI